MYWATDNIRSCQNIFSTDGNKKNENRFSIDFELIFFSLGFLTLIIVDWKKMYLSSLTFCLSTDTLNAYWNKLNPQDIMNFLSLLEWVVCKWRHLYDLPYLMLKVTVVLPANSLPSVFVWQVLFDVTDPVLDAKRDLENVKINWSKTTS